MSRDSRLLITLLDSRYDEKYSRWRSLFFYRSGMTTLREPTPYLSFGNEDGWASADLFFALYPLWVQGAYYMVA